MLMAVSTKGDAVSIKGDAVSIKGDIGRDADAG